MQEEEEEIESHINNIIMNTSFQSPITISAQKKDAHMSLERRLASGVLAEMIKIFKECTIQSTINDSGYYESDEQVDEINDSEKQVDARNWLRMDSAKQVDTISDAEKLVDAGSDPKSNPIRNQKEATHTTNGNFTQKKLINPTIPVVVGLINPLVAANLVGLQEMMSPRQTMLPKANVTDAALSCTRIFRTLGKINHTERDGATPRNFNSAKTNSRLSSQSPIFNSTYVSPARFCNHEVISPNHPNIEKGAGILIHLTVPLMDLWT